MKVLTNTANTDRCVCVSWGGRHDEQWPLKAAAHGQLMHLGINRSQLHVTSLIKRRRRTPQQECCVDVDGVWVGPRQQRSDR